MIGKKKNPKKIFEVRKKHKIRKKRVSIKKIKRLNWSFWDGATAATAAFAAAPATATAPAPATASATTVSNSTATATVVLTSADG